MERSPASKKLCLQTKLQDSRSASSGHFPSPGFAGLNVLRPVCVQISTLGLLGQDQFALLGSSKSIQGAIVFDPDFVAATRKLIKANDFGQVGFDLLLVKLRWLRVVLVGIGVV